MSLNIYLFGNNDIGAPAICLLCPDTQAFQPIADRIAQADMKVQTAVPIPDTIAAPTVLSSPWLYEYLVPIGLALMGLEKNGTALNIFQRLLPSDDQPLYDLGKSLDILNRGLQLEKISYEEIRSELKNDLVRLNNTPSDIPLAFGSYKYSTSSYGYRTHPVTLAKLDFHPGLDFAVEIGTPVMTTADGKVIATKYDTNLGLYVKIDHGNGFKTIYGHLRRFTVEKGDIVSRGDIVGNSGNSGRSTAPHLHYEVRHYNQRQNPSNYF